jgi:hypothetical protein
MMSLGLSTFLVTMAKRGLGSVVEAFWFLFSKREESIS